MRSQLMPDICSICGYLVRARHHHPPIREADVQSPSKRAAPGEPLGGVTHQRPQKTHLKHVYEACPLTAAAARRTSNVGVPRDQSSPVDLSKDPVAVGSSQFCIDHENCIANCSVQVGAKLKLCKHAANYTRRKIGLLVSRGENCTTHDQLYKKCENCFANARTR